MSARYIQNVEAGENFPSLTTLFRLRAVLRCDWAELFAGCDKVAILAARTPGKFFSLVPFIAFFGPLLGIIIGVAAVIILVTLGNGATQRVTEQIASLGSNLLMVSPGKRMGSGQNSGAAPFKPADAKAIILTPSERFLFLHRQPPADGVKVITWLPPLKSRSRTR